MKSKEKYNKMIGVHMPQSFYELISLVAEAYEITRTEEIRKVLWDWYDAKIPHRERFINDAAARIQTEWNQVKARERVFENPKVSKQDQKRASKFLEDTQNKLYYKGLSITDIEQIISKLRL